ncbi:MAG TPA: hypothetical protein VGJ86_19900, partial [Acidimicrobiales bacterium]
NIVLPVLYIATIVASIVGETWAYFYFLSIVESALLLLIIRYAWTWPRHVREGQVSGGQVSQGEVRAP